MMDTKEDKEEAKGEVKAETSQMATLDIELGVKEMMGEVDEAALQPALALLLKIIKNVLTSDDPKFRSINLSKPILQEKIGRFAACLRFLKVMGFHHDKQGMTSRLVSENKERLEHASLLLEEALFSLEKAAPATEDTARIEPDYDLSQVRVILNELNKQIAESVGGEPNSPEFERKLKNTLETLLHMTSNLLSGNDAKHRNLDVRQCEFFMQGWSKALDYLSFLGFEPDQDNVRLTLKNEHATKISRACSVLKRYIEESTPTEEQLLRREALRNPPDRQVQFFLPTPVVNPQLTSDYDRADASLLMQAAAAHQKRMKEQFPDVIITRQQRAVEKAKNKRKYDRTLVRVFFNAAQPESQIILQAYFHPYETTEALFAFIQAHLNTPRKAFYLLNPPETIEAPSTIAFDRSLDQPAPSSSSSSSGGARHLGSRLLGKGKDTKKANTTTFHLNSKPLPTLHDLKLVPAAALHFHWSDGAVLGSALLGECYQHRKPLELPNIPRPVNLPTEEPAQETKADKADKGAKEDPKTKKWRLKEEALKRKMGF